MLAFIHTSAAHVDTFGALLAELDPGIEARHLVDEALLVEARSSGASAVGVRQRVERAVQSLVSEGAKVVVCTCSTIGALVETTAVPSDVAVMRIDRPMAERAVAHGTRILVVASLASAVGPTVDLLTQTAFRANQTIKIVELLCENAWKWFEVGDVARYAREIATAIEESTQMPDVIVLAQASMARVPELLPDVRVPILSSPRLGLEAAVKKCHLAKKLLIAAQPRHCS